MLYLYDRLGRVVSRHPWTDSMAVRDSFVYDITGNVKKTITRRGDTLTTNYDSRNRDTLSVIPGVGTLRRAFGGPLDQVTRAWYDSPVDSIGGVNAELRWGFVLERSLQPEPCGPLRPDHPRCRLDRPPVAASAAIARKFSPRGARRS